jgi:hypothetical protein
MKSIILILLTLFLSMSFTFAQYQKATTEKGQIVILFTDGTWKYEDIKRSDISSQNMNVLSKYTFEQQQFINAWTVQSDNTSEINLNIFKVNPSAKDFLEGCNKNDFFIAPNSEDYFSGGLKVYINRRNLMEPTKSMCIVKIKEFSEKFRRRGSKTVSPQYIKFNQAFIQDCVNKFDFGGSFSTVKDDLNMLGGKVSGGAGRRDFWYIELPQKL